MQCMRGSFLRTGYREGVSGGDPLATPIPPARYPLISPPLGGGEGGAGEGVTPRRTGGPQLEAPRHIPGPSGGPTTPKRATHVFREKEG